MRKITFCIVLGLSLAFISLSFNLTRAVRLVPGSVPQTKPLQPLPIGIAPNLNKNVINNPGGAPPSSSSLPENNNTSANSPKSNSTSSMPTQSGNNLAVSDRVNPLNPLTIIFFSVLIGLGLAAYFLTNQKPH